jgi:hypothetical protein
MLAKVAVDEAVLLVVKVVENAVTTEAAGLGSNVVSVPAGRGETLSRSQSNQLLTTC